MMGQQESTSTSRGRSSSKGGASTTNGGRNVDWVAMAEAAVVSSDSLPRGIQTFPAAMIASSSAPAPTTAELPVGKQFFQVMQNAWRAPVPQAVAAANQSNNEPQMDPDDIMDAIQDTPGDVLSPPVRLAYMIDCLIELWDDEGLYD